MAEGQSPGAEWNVGERVLAHAAVGCVQGAVSGGNCGRGALSAAISEAASGSIIKFPALGVWGGIPESAEAGLVGGLTAEVSGGKFADGFSTGAAGYLFNSFLHRNETTDYLSVGEFIRAVDDDPDLSPGQRIPSLNRRTSLHTRTNK